MPYTDPEQLFGAERTGAPDSWPSSNGSRPSAAAVACQQSFWPLGVGTAGRALVAGAWEEGALPCYPHHHCVLAGHQKEVS